MPCEGAGKTLISAKEARRLARGQELYNATPFGIPRDRAGRILPHPAGCPRRRFVASHLPGTDRISDEAATKHRLMA
jgi:hypothetical protein